MWCWWYGPIEPDEWDIWRHNKEQMSLQAKAAAEAEAQRREEAERRAQMQQEAQERLRQLEEEERQAEERYRERYRLDLEDGEALPDRAGRRLLEQRLQESDAAPADADPPNNSQGNTPAAGGNAAGLAPEEYRMQLREVELRVCL